jgi:ankyrin repeat protein
LFDASETGSLNDIELLLDNMKNPYPIDINAKGLDGWTALHFASNEGHHEVVSFLLKHKVDLEAITNMGRKALHIATIRGNYEVVELLILAKAQINCQDAESYTPLHYASENGHEKILHLLLQQKPDLKLKNFQGMYAVDLCLNIKIREIFECHGCDFSSEDEHYGRTAFGNCILSNSRADHVGKFLMWGMQNRQK